MKKLIYTLVFAGFSVVSFAQTKVSFEVKNAPSDTLTISSRAGKVKDIIAKKKGKFDSTLELPQDGFYKLDLGDQYTNLYLTKTTDLKATLDYSDFDNTIKYSGNGGAENNFLADLMLNQEKDMMPFEKAKSEDELNKFVTSYLDTFNKKIDEAKLDATFANLMKTSQERSVKGMAQYMKGSFALKDLAGKPSPTFNYENFKGGKTTLESFKGKYVYVDVWATWCGPCRQEIPFLQKTEQAFHGKNIEFVSISIDEQKNRDKWLTFVKEKQLGGVQLLADNAWASQFVQDYKINGIPRFILIGPNGEIVNADAPRPSSPELKTLLDSLVK